MPPDPGVMFVLFLFGTVALAGVAYLVLLVARWHRNRIHYVQQPRVRSVRLRSDDRRFTAVSPAETNDETDETTGSPTETEQEKIAFAETYAAEVVARLILAEELDLTPTIKIGFGKKSGEGYQKYSRLVRAAMERQKESITPIAGRSTPAQFASDKRT